VRRGLAEFVRQNESVHEEGFGLWRSARVPGHQLLERLRSRW
jgi:hypothetical protein